MPRDEAIDPFAQLERCHRRLEEACAALGEAVDAHDLETVADVAAFFARQIKRHEDDEDRSLFPRLQGRPELAADLARLTDEHVEHGKLQVRLDDAVAGRLDPSADLWKELGAVADALIRAYRAHIDVEETRIFPAARATLGPTDLAAIRTEMDARRGRT
ncbi:MAG: hemerythrin domain-containing protein [Labilithrix sp.]|nr:hemerythrin domain-containing protein [Labilithrix sp.]MCW5811889.1 hemerythrin domain-containing protein [Labilithrix sp.]